jgi:hypothetical protein
MKSQADKKRTKKEFQVGDMVYINALFVWLISHQPTVLFSQNKPATSNQPAVLFSQNKPAPAISHQPNEQAEPHVQSSVALRSNNKLSFKFYGPYKILQRVGKVVHISQLKLHISPTVPATEATGGGRGSSPPYRSPARGQTLSYRGRNDHVWATW